ncbi:MAG: ATP-binding protein [Pirellulaceae bacterium]
MQDFEKLGAFYLGRVFDMDRNRATSELLLYDSKDLTTHAVCVGMTGSGKTGLCLSLLEEEAMDRIPAIAVDPKGDLGNLLLTFPDLKPSDFRPWIDSDTATREGYSPDQYASRIADRWRRGLAEWGQTPDRLARFRETVDVSIYTPGSNAGLPLTVLRSFAAPPPAVLDDADALRERILSAVSGLLALLGIDADPIRSREHILVSNILDRAWREGRSPDMGSLIREIQSPPFQKIGVMDLDSVFPAADRYRLAMQLNNLLASPGFSAWMEGEPLDIQRLLYTTEGQPRLSVVSIAHLSDSERMFFVTILLNEITSWMRSQPGTSSLRALLYMDEVFGYFPPTANPPSKRPMLTLLKQARAFGLCVVLATQNPVDLDYKGLSNAGTWFLGRLQTERDKARVLDGLEGASANAGSTFDRKRMETILSGLGSRVFLMNNVHDDEPVVFQTRWAMSYLRGPLTRSQIQTLMQPRKAILAATATPAPKRVVCDTDPTANQRPVVPPGIEEVFLLPKRSSSADGAMVYRPALFGVARVHFVRSTADVDWWETVALLRAVSGSPPEDMWKEAESIEQDEFDCDTEPASGARFANLPSEFTRPQSFSSWKKALKNHLYQSHTLRLFKCSTLKATSRPGESKGDFRVRLRQRATEQRDLAVEKLRKRYSPKLRRLQERIRKAEQAVAREKSQVHQQTLQTALSIGTTVLGALFGRKLGSRTNVTRAASSMRSAGRVASQSGDVQRARENVETLQQQMQDLENEFQKESTEVRERYQPDELEVAELPIRPRKSDLSVEQVTLVWTPWRVDASGIAEPAF